MGQVPVILFTYNRLDHLKRTIETLKSVDGALETSLYIYSDGGKNLEDVKKVADVRNYLSDLSGFKSVSVAERPENFGLAKNVISGVNEVLSIHASAIVLEDDISVSKDYLQVMNKLLVHYEKNRSIGSISGYMYPVALPEDIDDFFLLPRASSWGWATWANRWNHVDWEVADFDQFYLDKKEQELFNQGGEDLTPMLIKWKLGLNDSWAVRWIYHHFKQEMQCLFPKHNMATNHGTDGSGTHSPKTTRFAGKQFDLVERRYPSKPVLVPTVLTGLQQFFKLSFIRKLINKVTFTLKYRINS